MLMVAALLSACAASPFATAERAPSRQIDDWAGTRLGQMFADQAEQNPGASGLQWIATGSTALYARLALADMASRSLDLQYYSVGADDSTTKELLERLLRASRRGVRIRILLDDIHPGARLFGRQIMRMDSSIEVRLYNPFNTGPVVTRILELAFDGERLNRRMHNKLWIADNAVAIVGSRNLGDQYFDAKPGENFKDLDALTVGPVVRSMSDSFDQYWNSPQSIPLSYFDSRSDVATAVTSVESEATSRSVPPPPLSDAGEERTIRAFEQALGSGQIELQWGPAIFEADDPQVEKQAVASGIEHGAPADRPWGVHTEQELLIISPYFVPGESALQHLRSMTAAGIRVALLTNSTASTDSLTAHAGYVKYRGSLLDAGVQVFEFRPDGSNESRRRRRWGDVSSNSLHAKAVVQDRRRVIIGSTNQDPRSRLHNRESWLVFDNLESAARLSQLFDESVDPSHSFAVLPCQCSGRTAMIWVYENDTAVIQSQTEPAASAWRVLVRRLLGLLVPEHLL